MSSLKSTSFKELFDQLCETKADRKKVLLDLWSSLSYESQCECFEDIIAHFKTKRSDIIGAGESSLFPLLLQEYISMKANVFSIFDEDDTNIYLFKNRSNYYILCNTQCGYYICVDPYTKKYHMKKTWDDIIQWIELMKIDYDNSLIQNENPVNDDANEDAN